MEVKYNKTQWKWTAILFPLFWIALLLKYILSDDQCFRSGLKVACGWQAILMLVGWFVFCMIWPFIYFLKVRPVVKNQEPTQYTEDDLIEYGDPWWKRAAWFFPLIPISGLIAMYVGGYEYAIHRNSVIIAAWQIYLALFVTLVASLYFPYTYFTKAKSFIELKKKKDEEDVRRIFEDEKNWK